MGLILGVHYCCWQEFNREQECILAKGVNNGLIKTVTVTRYLHA